MNVTRENLTDLDLLIKVEISENDYTENLTKQLKDYKNRVVIPGFRKGMAPLSMIQRQYRGPILADIIEEMLSKSLNDYIESEKLNIIGFPLSNTEKTPQATFSTDKDFTFYFDAALSPQVKIEWDKIDTPLFNIKVTPKDVDTFIKSASERFGKFETPETIGEGDQIYCRVEEVDDNGETKESGFKAFGYFNTADIKDPDTAALFIGKKTEDKIIANSSKMFTPSVAERALHITNAEAKKLKANLSFTITAISHITPAELDEQLFKQVFPDNDITTLEAFRKMVSESIEKENERNSHNAFVSQVHQKLIDNFDAPMPEAFLKRWLLRVNDDKKVTAETIEAEWAEKYLPSIKWEFILGEIEKTDSITATHNEMVDYVKDIFLSSEKMKDDETEEQYKERIEKAAQDFIGMGDYGRSISDTITENKLFEYFKKQLNPQVEKVTAKEFSERLK